jgi:hypothetical protein|tara:strand:+ start:569 stop:766 length:198 start_codon:yes stop_codon:yes gene_type:complete
MIKVGDLVDSKFGKATVINIELCEERGDKYGETVHEVEEYMKDYCVFDLDNGHWQRGGDISIDFI